MFLTNGMEDLGIFHPSQSTLYSIFKVRWIFRPVVVKSTKKGSVFLTEPSCGNVSLEELRSERPLRP